MPEWCPNCNAMLPEGLETCPRCKSKLGKSKQAGFSISDYFHYSLYAIGIALVPVIIVLIISMVCILTKK
ncbi:MAG: hypothetical protein AB1345_07320 [Chloroflexota bacterium]